MKKIYRIDCLYDKDSFIYVKHPNKKIKKMKKNASRKAKSVIKDCKKHGKKVGMFIRYTDNVLSCLNVQFFERIYDYRELGCWGLIRVMHLPEPREVSNVLTQKLQGIL